MVYYSSIIPEQPNPIDKTQSYSDFFCFQQCNKPTWRQYAVYDNNKNTIKAHVCCSPIY